MVSLLKNFIIIVLSCIGIGFSFALPEFGRVLLVVLFTAFDVVGVLCCFFPAKCDLWGVFCIFAPLLAIALFLDETQVFFNNAAKTTLLSLEFSSAIVLFYIIVWNFVFLCKNIKKQRYLKREEG